MYILLYYYFQENTSSKMSLMDFQINEALLRQSFEDEYSFEYNYEEQENDYYTFLFEEFNNASDEHIQKLNAEDAEKEKEKVERRNFTHPKRAGDDRRKRLLKEKESRNKEEERRKKREKRIEDRGKGRSVSPATVVYDF